MSMANGFNLPSFNDTGGTDSNSNNPPDISNYTKYMGNVFSLIDTNAVASGDTNLYNALLTFRDTTNTSPTLQGFALSKRHDFQGDPF